MRHTAAWGEECLGDSAEGLTPFVGGEEGLGALGGVPRESAQAQEACPGAGTHAPWRVGCRGSTRLRTQHQILCDLCQVTWAPASVFSPGKWGSVRVHLSVVKLESLAHAKYSGCHRHGIFTPRLTEGVRSGAGEAAEDPPGPYESLIFY